MSIKAFYTMNDGRNPVSMSILAEMRKKNLPSNGVRYIALQPGQILEGYESGEVVALYDSRLNLPGYYTPTRANCVTPSDRPDWVLQGSWVVQVRISKNVDARVPTCGHQLTSMFVLKYDESLASGREPWGQRPKVRPPRQREPWLPARARYKSERVWY